MKTGAGGLRIAITADPYIPVPPVYYGGIERMIDILVRGLARRGHSVTLFAHPESRVPADLHPYGVPPHTTPVARARELWQLASGLIGVAGRTDIVHSFGRLASLLPLLPRRLPKVQSYQRAIPWRGVSRAARLGGESIVFTGCSSSLYAQAQADGSASGSWRTIFNAVDTTHYTPVEQVSGDAPLMFLGRVQPLKGPHHAIAIARQAGRRLVLAGNLEPVDLGYFHSEIEPAIDDDQVTYVGPVDDVRKNELLGQAAALLMPIGFDEPFGIVMAEAMACGTPVIGFPLGSVPEVVRDGVNGFVADGVDAAAVAVGRLGGISRRAVRLDCEQRFSHEVIVAQYERLYHEMIERVRRR
jgi:glycosyltransferase involved in cell wall biosynthesis